MKKLLILTVLLLLYCSQCFAKVDLNARIAVMDFGTRPGASTSEINIQNAEYTSSEYMIKKLIESNCFVVVDKDVAFSKIKERGYKTTGLIDPDTAKGIGTMLNAKYLLYGNIAGVTDSGTGAGAMALGNGVSVNVCTIKAHIVARLMDVETGQILMAVRGEGNSKSSYVRARAFPIIVVNVGTKKVTQDSVHNAIEKAAYNAVDNMIANIKGTKKK